MYHDENTGTHGAPPDQLSGLRAPDADREATCSVLRRHHAQGRLETEELDARIGRCYAATTIGDLPGLVTHLPSVWPDAFAPSCAGSHAHQPVWTVATLATALALVALLALGATRLLWFAAIPIGMALTRRRSFPYCRATARGLSSGGAGPPLGLPVDTGLTLSCCTACSSRCTPPPAWSPSSRDRSLSGVAPRLPPISGR